jgi:phosphatidylinositol alpha-mannosyltransferase
MVVLKIMNIVLVSPYDITHPGGVSEHVIALARGLSSRKHSVHILAASSEQQPHLSPLVRPVTSTVLRVSVGGAVARIGISPLSYFRIKKIFHSAAVDVVHLHEPLVPGLNWGALLLATRLPETVTIGTFHAFRERSSGICQLGLRVLHPFFNRLDALIAVSEVAQEFASRWFPGNYTIIPNGIELDRFGRDNWSPRPARQVVTILFVGRLEKRKGFETLFEAFAQLKSSKRLVRLQVVGPIGNRKREFYQRMAHSRGVTDIEFSGYIPPRQLPAYYQNADIFCAPAVGDESFGIVLLEAMAAGLPVVASDIAGYRTVVASGQEGILVPPGQPDALARALQYLIEQPQWRNDMGLRGRQKAKNYSWDLIVEQTLAVYMDTLNRVQKKSVLLPDVNTTPPPRRHVEYV